MQFLSDIFLAAGAFGAAIYCYVLATRLKRFSTLETGMGGAIAVLSAQVDDMTKALEVARTSAASSAATLENLTARAAADTTRLELLLASLHDLPEAKTAPDETESEDRKLRFVRRRSQRDELEAAE